ncbi:cell wall glucanase [Pyrenophora seminiperda CCB06]|uniref:Cell wall glucanase n=1 Tax=Pyrenophora seminiperda CCB06 TaxID=1302712 RepID=A0A3M7M4V2_9PLEO|nr:cell wall glucanase [Pyrenophora seminiperda CCB06]
MHAHSLDTGWDFNSVIDLIDSGAHDISSPALRPTGPAAIPDSQDGGVRLGSFSKLFESLGFADVTPAPPSPFETDSELSNSDENLIPSPVLEPPRTRVKHGEMAEEQAGNHTGMTKTQRKKARRRAEKEMAAEQGRTRAKENFDQFAEESEQMSRQAQRASLRKQLDELASTPKKAIYTPETPCKASRAHSRSNVGAKLRPTTLSLALVSDPTEAHRIQPQQPTPSKARLSTLKRPSEPQPKTPQQPQQAPVVIPSTAPASDQRQYTTFGTLAPPQYVLPEPQQPAQYTTPLHNGLVPRTVRPTTLPRTASQPAPAVQPPVTPTPNVVSFSGRRPPLTIRSQVDRHFNLLHKLLNTFPEDRKWLLAPMQLLNERVSTQGLHIFVDASNIMIGLKEMLRYHGLQHNSYDMSFDSLALLMERRRPVAKRFFAGSHREANPLPHVAKIVETSKAVGYDSVMQEQVLIVREDSEKKKFFNDVKKMGWHKATQLRTGSGSDSETGAPAPKTPSAPKWVEQGVDEILHLKMCQSIIDCEVPSTMVLATGDGAVAEMSDGFLAHVERALKRGWKVELISWGQQINSGYRKRQFRAKWAEQFTIIELDQFLEDVIDTP